MKNFKTSAGVVSAVLVMAISTGCDNKTEAPTEVDVPAIEEVVAETTAPESEEKLSLSASNTRQITATVTAIDLETRLVSLTNPEGKMVVFTASEDVRNLEQVSIGDMVAAEYTQSVSIEVVSLENSEPSVAGIAAVARTEEGEMPGAAIVESEIQVYTVEDINIEANTFKLKDVYDVVTEYVAQNPENLTKAAVGDSVIVTIIESFAISVEGAATE